MTAIYVLWLREIKRYTRSRVQIIVSLGQPVLYFLALGYGLSPIFRRSGAGNYVQFVAPGIISMNVLFEASFSGVELLWDRQFGFLKETLVAPVPRLQVMIGRTSGAATTAMLRGVLLALVCVLAGFRPVSLTLLPLALGFLALIALTSAALGTTIGSILKDVRGFQMVMNFLVLPMFLLSGALFPLQNLPALLSILTRIDPMTYGVDGLRTALIAQTHFGVVTDALVLGGLAVIVVGLGAWRFSRIEV